MADDELKTYRGNCHCAAFVYEVKLPEIKTLSQCNCSMCHKKGYAWLFLADGNLTFVKGSVDGLTAYRFNSEDFMHRFCPDCGTPVMAENPKLPEGMKTGLNARAIQDLDIWSLEEKPVYDGKALPQPYKAPVYTGPEPTAEVENGRTYHGSCHCGAVTLAVKVKPLETWDISKEEERIVECNCSICVRNAYIWIYTQKDQTAVQGEDNLSYRIFNSKLTRKAFCKHCGVPMYNEAAAFTGKPPLPPLSYLTASQCHCLLPSDLTRPPSTDEEIAALSNDAKRIHAYMRSRRNINVRILNDFDSSTLKTKRLDGKTELKSDYVNP